MNQQMSPEDAGAVLYQQVSVPAFCEKCAELGMPIQSEEQLQGALTIVEQLMKQSSTQSEALTKAAAAGLNQQFGETPAQQVQRTEADIAQSIKVAQDDSVRAAISAHLAAALNAQPAA
jgi:hypothetical protein